MPGFFEGPVIDNVDPQKQGRVRVRLPGVMDNDGTPWARPMGLPGAGTMQRGTFAVPPIGAEVGVMFVHGDPDQPRYFCGYPGENETPAEVQEASAEDATKVYKHESDRFYFLIDDRPGKWRAALVDKKSGTMVEVDGVNLGVNITGATGVTFQVVGAFNVQASSITLNGRKISPSTKPI